MTPILKQQSAFEVHQKVRRTR